jgi:pimeloyl-ACP methyl ester carboxylesterase
MTNPDWMQIDWPNHLRWVRVQDRLINVVDIGQGPSTIVFLHGLSGCWQNWLQTIPELARDHRVIAIDFPGFGQSEMPANAISIPGYARMLDELFGALAIGSATIVGNSMGGFVGVDFAMRFPERVERLVLVAAAGLSMEHMLNERNQGLRARVENFLFFGLGRLAAYADIVVRSPTLRRGLLLLVVAHPDRLPGPLVLEQVNGAGKPGFHDALDAMVGYPIRDRLGEIDTPTLIVWGELDRLVPLRDASEFEWLIRGARKLVYEDTGHMVMLERPERFNTDLLAFVDSDGAGHSAGIPPPWQQLRET